MSPPALVFPGPTVSNCLFVYGTLLSTYVPQGDTPLVPPPTLRTARKIGAAVLRGFYLCELSKYCCIVPTPNDTANVVHGELYQVADEHADWAVLDEYEGIDELEEEPYEYRREVSSALSFPPLLTECRK